jgi:hypothetical protein
MFLMPARSDGSLIAGSQLNITGDGTVGATFLNWACDDPTGPVCPSGSGDFGIGNAPVGTTFNQYNGTSGFIKDLNNTSQPLNTAFLLSSFMTFVNSNEVIDLTFIPLGTDTPSTTCSGLSHCTPEIGALVNATTNPMGLSSFNLDQGSQGTAASFGIQGTIRDSSGASAPLTGTYTAQFNGDTPSQVLALFAGAGANGLASTYSAQLSFTLVPEPMSLSLMGIGLLALGLLRRKMSNNSRTI